MLEASLFNQIDYTGARRLLEVGNGLSAQTEMLLRVVSRPLPRYCATTS